MRLDLRQPTGRQRIALDEMREMKISREAWAAVQHALINIDEVVGDDIAVTIVLHDAKGRLYTATDGPPDDLEIRFVGRSMQ